MNFKARVFRAIDENLNDQTPFNIFDIGIVILIVLNVFAVIIESCLSTVPFGFQLFEYFSVAVFTLDYVLRLWTADLKRPKLGKVKAKLAFAFSFMGLVDLVSFAPFYIGLLMPMAFDARILRMFRLFRLLRVLKLTRYIESLGLLKNVVYKRRRELEMTVFLAFLLLIISSTLMYQLEHDAQPDKFTDIPAAMWWAVATLTTIGYGDIIPITAAGKLVGSVIAFIGVGFIALPTGIIATSLIEEFRNKHEHELSTRKEAARSLPRPKHHIPRTPRALYRHKKACSHKKP